MKNRPFEVIHRFIKKLIRDILNAVLYFFYVTVFPRLALAHCQLSNGCGFALQTFDPTLLSRRDNDQAQRTLPLQQLINYNSLEN